LRYYLFNQKYQTGNYKGVLFMSKTILERLEAKSKTVTQKQLMKLAKTGNYKTKLMVLDHPNCSYDIKTLLFSDKSKKVSQKARNLVEQDLAKETTEEGLDDLYYSISVGKLPETPVSDEWVFDPAIIDQNTEDALEDTTLGKILNSNAIYIAFGVLFVVAGAAILLF
jgi:hypothetical protein